MAMKFDKIRKFVKSKYPTAKTAIDNDGKYFVSDKDGKLMQDYYIPNQNKAFPAWRAVYDIIKIDQNIQRTHPDKMIMEYSENSEEKSMRITKRRNRCG